MCLIIIPEKTQRYRKKYKPTDKIVIYKKVDVQRGFNPNKIYCRSFYQRIKYHGGWMKADRITVCDGMVYNSIHAYLRKRKNKGMRYNSYILKCWAYAKDLVAVGEYGIAFSKIWVPKSEIDRAIKDYKSEKLFRK